MFHSRSTVSSIWPGSWESLPADWVHDHYHTVRLVSCIGFIAMCAFGAVHYLVSLSSIGPIFLFVPVVIFVVVAVILRLSSLPGWATEATFVIALILANVVTLFITFWTCDSDYPETRGRSFGFISVAIKACFVINGVRIHLACVVSTLSWLCDVLFIVGCCLHYDSNGNATTHLFCFGMYIATIATIIARHSELRMLYNAKAQLIVQMDAVQTLANWNSDAIVWVQSDGNGLEQRDERLGRWLGVDEDSNASSCFSDFLEPEAFAQFQKLLRTPQESPVSMLPSRLRHASGEMLAAELAIVDLRSLECGNNIELRKERSAKRKTGFLIAISIMDYAGTLKSETVAPLPPQRHTHEIVSLPTTTNSFSICCVDRSPLVSFDAESIPGQVSNVPAVPAPVPSAMPRVHPEHCETAVGSAGDSISEPFPSRLMSIIPAGKAKSTERHAVE
eukprot:TRINITY_DN35484_c0_g3_i1.p1 TRINITY_DN35484_c0_g3~~TRINITY_DN35484_c0_g3_i1.p1  ORF type:complete len:448 (-),score=60.88 TRINITY_DN35484_c0_g3_i1:254-1597(-)